ncbi:MAG: phage shock protein E [Polaribacter sp.]|jgi:phage shock protein E
MIDDEFKSRMNDLNRSAKYLFVCPSGGLSTRASREAQELGFDRIYNLKGGMLAWNNNDQDKTRLKY